MTTRQLGQLLKLLRREGVTRYADGGISIELGAARADKQDKQSASAKAEKDDAAPQEVTPPTEGETIDDPRAWLEEKYRAAGIVTKGAQ